MCDTLGMLSVSECICIDIEYEKEPNWVKQVLRGWFGIVLGDQRLFYSIPPQNNNSIFNTRLLQETEEEEEKGVTTQQQQLIVHTHKTHKLWYL